MTSDFRFSLDDFLAMGQLLENSIWENSICVDDENSLESGIFVKVSVASDWEDRRFSKPGTSAIFGVIVFLEDSLSL